ncbi:MAG: NMD protein affecting ribosome stability and mRNA decay [Methanosarcinaceae archaeon]|nr:NMD protein affecting ribosome stability and mRNA decay [Methanosarcinaceae archaeon]
MSSIICPKCGKDTKKLYGNVCKECYLKKLTLLQLPLVLHLKICATCGAHFDRGKWKDTTDLDDIIIEKVNNELMVHEDAEDIDLYIEPIKKSPYIYNIRVKVDATVYGDPIHEEVNTEIRLDREACDICSRIAGGYFEAIVQIRGTGRTPDANEKKKCMQITNDVLIQMENKGDRLAFVSHTIDSKDGIDLYIGSANTGRHLCKTIKTEIGGSFSESPTLFGQKEGKEIYRVTFAMRLPQYTSGEIIYTGGRTVEVKTCGKNVKGIDLVTGSRFLAKLEDVEDAERLGMVHDASMAVLVTVEDDTIMVLHPSTYQTVTIQRPLFLESKAGEEIPVLANEHGLVVIPKKDYDKY